MFKATLGERAVSAALGALFGSLIGLAIAWIFGVYSNVLGPSTLEVSFRHWAFGVGSLFALVGLLTGGHVGTLIGSMIAGILEFERGDPESPVWVAVAALAIFAIGIWLWLKQ